MQSFLPTETDTRRNHDVNENYKLLLIIPCRIKNVAQNIYIAITLEKTKAIFLNFRIVAGFLPYKPRNLGIKISHGYQEIAFCPVHWVFHLSQPVCHCIHVMYEAACTLTQADG